MPRDVRHGPGGVPAHGRQRTDGAGLRSPRAPRRRLRVRERVLSKSRPEREHRRGRLSRPHPRLRSVPPRFRRPATGLTSGEKRLLLSLVGSLTFASVYATLVMAPVLTQLSDEFGVSTGTAGVVAAAYGGPGIVTSLLGGPYSDRFGRKVFLVAGAFIMGVFTILAALAPTFETLVLARAIAGIGGSLIFPNAHALVGDVFPHGGRGRAMATVIGFNTMASRIGWPVAGVVAEATSWRVSVGLVGVIAIAAGTGLAIFLRPSSSNINQQLLLAIYRLILSNGSAVAAIISRFPGSPYWFTWIPYLAAFFPPAYGLSEGRAATYSLTLGLGVLIGSQIGGRIGDRIGHRRVVAGTIVGSGLILLVLTNASPPLLAAAALNVALSAVIRARFS